MRASNATHTNIERERASEGTSVTHPSLAFAVSQRVRLKASPLSRWNSIRKEEKRRNHERGNESTIADEEQSGGLERVISVQALLALAMIYGCSC